MFEEKEFNSDQIQVFIPRLPYKIQKTDSAKEPTNEEEKQILSHITSYLEKKCWFWDITDADKFVFDLPATVFRQGNKIEFKEFEEAEVEYFENFESRNLTKEQRDEIWQKGQFTLKSKIPCLPYIWTISEWLFKGIDKRNANFVYDMYLVFYYLYYLRNRFRKDKRHPFFSVVFSFIFLKKGVKDLYSMVCGRPFYNYTYINNIRNPKNLRDVLLKQYYENLIKDNPQIVASVYLPKTSAIINEIHSNFERGWKDLRIHKEHELRILGLSPSEIKEKVQDYRVDLLVHEYDRSEKLDERKKKYIIEILKANRIFDKIQIDYDKQYKADKDALREKLCEENPIRSNSKRWLELLTIENFKTRAEELERLRDIRVDQELFNYPTAKIMIKSFINFEKYYDQNLKLLAERNTREPYMIKDIRSKCYPPFEVYKLQDTYDKKYYFYLRTSTSVKVDTLHHFWRFKITYHRLMADYHNIIRWGWFNCWNSSFGLKAFCAPYIVKRYLIDSKTGVVKESETSFTYSSAFTSLGKWIKDSRDAFERAGDNGFLGSKTGRVINYIENYFLKLILWGFVIAVLYPLAIILLTLFSFLWMIFCLVFMTLFRPFQQFIFNVFIFDTEGLDVIDCPCLPIFWIIFKRFIFQFLVNLIMSICLIFIQIFIGLFMLVFGCLRWLIRGFYDCLTFIIIRCNGNIPKVNTSIAWRIAGPGISRSLFYRIEVDDGLLLVRGELEKLQLEDYRTKVHAIIEEPRKIHDTISNTIFANCYGYLNVHPQVSDSVNKYYNVIGNQISKRNECYPYINNKIRFSKENLAILLEASHDLIKDFVEKNGLKSIWNTFELVPGTYDLLTIKILKKVFNSENILTNVDETEAVVDHQDNQHEERERIHKELNLDSFVAKSKERRMKKGSAFSGLIISGADEDNDTYVKPASSFGEMYANLQFLRDGKHLGITSDYLEEATKKRLEEEEK
jgi:hypothetical protein